MFALGVKVVKKNRIPEVRDSLRPRAEKILNQGAMQIASLAFQFCPVGKENYTDEEGNKHPGHLRSTIAIETYSGNRPGYGVAKRVGVGAPYAPWVEIHAPFLMPAFEAVKPSIIAAFERLAKL